MNLTKSLKDNISLKGHYTFTLEDIHTGEKQIFEYENLITEDAWEMIANNLTDPTPTYSMLINKAVLGTGTTPPAITDHQLQTEVYRNNPASKSNAANLAYVTAYFAATEVSGTFREAGLVVDGTGTANSGLLFSHVAINITKTTSQTLTLDWTLTIS